MGVRHITDSRKLIFPLDLSKEHQTLSSSRSPWNSLSPKNIKPFPLHDLPGIPSIQRTSNPFSLWPPPLFIIMTFVHIHTTTSHLPKKP
jgi:hypothetical protein